MLECIKGKRKALRVLVKIHSLYGILNDMHWSSQFTFTTSLSDFRRHSYLKPVSDTLVLERYGNP